MAASGTAVTVLTPNGRRQTVKVAPNTPLLQVLEDVCKKHGFNPDEHGLKFQRTVLDLTLPWRFANLPNNAKLEMVTSTRKQGATDSQVRIALQMEDGSRLQDSFSSGLNLWEVLTHFPQISVSELSDSGSTPVCVYMRDEVSGEEALKKATLKSLGLTGGSAIVRFLLKKDKTPGEEDEPETPAMPTTPVAKETTPSVSPQPDPVPSLPEASTTTVPIKNSSPDSPMETIPAPVPMMATDTTPVQNKDVPNSQDAVQPKVPPTGRQTPEADGEEAGPSGLNCHPSSSAPSAPFIPFSGGGRRLGGPGGGAVGRSLSSSSSSSLSALTAAVESPKAKKAKSSHSSSSKGSINENISVETLMSLQPVEREPLIYHLDSMSHHSEDLSDLPDEFFEVTVDDIRKRFAQLKSERKLLEESPLMTKSLREAQMKEKMDRYPKVVLRVQFPDRHVLQGFFRPLETVGAVKQFVRSHLEDPQLSFYLCKSSVPVTQLSFKTFCVVFLVLSSYLSCMLRSPTPLSSSVGFKESLPPAQEPTANSSGSTQDERDLSAQTQAAKPTRSDPGKVPKWLKLPGQNRMANTHN
uniref:RBD domain-containing protein n=1 Tax=Amphiprion ocellaris TaxID=80972 RepID=A0AAQ5Z3W6_AMPOC